MVSKAFKTCLLLIEKMVKHGYVNQIDKAELEKLITRYIGADERTIKKYTRVCVQCEFLKPHIWEQNKRGNINYDNVSVFCINLRKADHEMREVFSRPMKQLTLQEAKS